MESGGLPSPVADNVDGVTALIEEDLTGSNILPAIAGRQDDVTAGTTIEHNRGGLLAIGSRVA